MPEAKILAVLDENSPLKVLKKALSSVGAITICHSAFDAIHQLRSEPSDLIIASASLPDMTGFQLSCLIKSSDATKDIPLVLFGNKAELDGGFAQRTSLADLSFDFKDLETDEKAVAAKVKSLLTTVKDDVDRLGLRNSPLIPEMVANTDTLSGFRDLVSNLLIERRVNQLSHNLLESVGNRVLFMAQFVTFMKNVFESEVTGLIVADPASHWAFYEANGINRAALEKVQASATKSLALSMQPRSIFQGEERSINGELSEKGGATLKSQEVIPVLGSNNEVIGAIVLGWTGKHSASAGQKTVSAFLQTHMRPVFKALFALQQIQMLQQQHDYSAYTDPITGLYNLEFLIGFLQQQLLFSKRQQLPVGVLLIDIDHFLETNNDHGPDTGDMVLMTLANRLNKSVRSSDLLARYAGDQFAIVLPNTDVPGTKIVAEKLRHDVDSIKWESLSGKPLHVTVSVGGATFNMEDVNAETILRDAKMALLSAKEGGRNRIALAPLAG